MRVAVFSSRPYDRTFLDAANEEFGHEFVYFEARLTPATAVLAEGFPAVSAFVNDELDCETLEALRAGGTRLVALRSAGFNNVDLRAAAAAGIRVTRVPGYTPHAIAEHAVALMLSLDRNIHRAYTRVRDGNFALDSLLGFDLHGRTVGIIGTGRIGAVVARIMAGFGCHLLAYDPFPNERVRELGAKYVELPRLLAESDIVTIHAPLTKETRHLIDRRAVSQMKRGVMLINTSRGELVDSLAVIDGLKSGQIGYLGLDVYEEEEEVFSYDLSGQIIQDDVLSRFLTLPNVLITAHQGYFTRDALREIAGATLRAIDDFAAGRELKDEVRCPPEGEEAGPARAA